MDRQRWMATLARASADEMSAVLPRPAPYTRLRGPEVGLLMTRGRAGGGGAAFNLGEVSVTRCTVRTEAGQVGHAYVLGRDERRAELAAVADAMLQADPGLAAEIVAPLAAAQAARRGAVAARAAATQVEFFTLATMRT